MATAASSAALLGGGVALGAAAAVVCCAANPSMEQAHAQPDTTQDTRQEAVLRFWFGGSAKEQYATLWFAPNNSPQQATADAAIRDRFGDLLAAAERGELEGWRSTPRGLLVLIVLLDQFTRHVHRGDCKRGRMGGGEPNDAKALACAEEMLTRQWEARLGVAELVFALMPLRHSPTPERLQRVLGHLDARDSQNEQLVDLLERFRRQTTRRLADAQAAERKLASAK